MKNSLLVALIALSMGWNSLAQEYKDLPEEVQQQMDRNKAAGEDLYAHIQRKMTFTFDRVTSQEEADRLKEHLDASYTIISCSYRSSDKSVLILTSGEVRPKDVLEIARETFGYDEFFGQSFIVQ